MGSGSWGPSTLHPSPYPSELCSRDSGGWGGLCPISITVSIKIEFTDTHPWCYRITGPQRANEPKRKQITETCKYIIDIGSDGNLMAIRMFSLPNITKLNKMKKYCMHATIHAYPKCLCRVTIINKVTGNQCSFFVVHGNGPALLGMQDCERLQLLSINCQTTNDQQKGRQINKQTR